MFLLIYFAVVIVTIYFWYQKNYGHRNELLAKFPGPKSYPILNHLTYILGKSPSDILKITLNFSKEFGSVWRFDLNPFISTITVSDPKIVEEILSSQKLIDKSVEYDLLSVWLGRGLITSSGNKWFQRRRIITPAFHFKILEQFVEIMEKHGQNLMKKLNRIDGQKVDIFSIISLYTLDVICESAMGCDLKAQEDDTSEYVKAVKEMSSIFFQKVFDPKKRIQWLYQFTSLYQKEQAQLKKLHNFTLSVIESRRKYLKECAKNTELVNSEDEFGIKKKTAFLDLLLKTEIDGQPLDDASIREEVDTFMFAGHDTTSSALSSILLNLAKHPKSQKRIYDECEEIFSENRQLTIQDFNKMNYLEKVIKESLRIYPAVSSYSRKFLEDVKIGDYVFPSDVSIKISMYNMGRDPSLFPDPLKFDPSRFDDDRNIRLFSFVPFSAGPRNCMGQKFAMVEMKSVLSKIVRNFIICVDKEDENPLYAQEVILRPINGINLRFKSRNN